MTAAQRLIDRFHPAGARAGAGWTNHQTIRLRTFLGTMQPGSAALCATIATGHWAALAKSVTCARLSCCHLCRHHYGYIQISLTPSRVDARMVFTRGQRRDNHAASAAWLSREASAGAWSATASTWKGW